MVIVPHMSKICQGEYDGMIRKRKKIYKCDVPIIFVFKTEGSHRFSISV